MVLVQCLGVKQLLSGAIHLNEKIVFSVILNQQNIEFIYKLGKSCSVIFFLICSYFDI